MAQRIAEFDTWQPGYGGAVVNVNIAGTSTLATLFTDEALTISADNPQTLSAKIANDGTSYGKFAAPIYTASSYYLSIDGIENTGIVRAALADFAGENVSAATVKPTRSSFDLTLAKYSDLSVKVATYGIFVEGSGGVAADNNATLVLAIAALSSGGEVIIPAGTYKVTSASIPEGVVLRGQGRESTELQSILGDVSFTLTGDRAGFRHLLIDGSSLTASSVAVKSVGKDEIVFDDVMIKRFETGLHVLGGKGFVWNDFSIENVGTGVKLHGDLDAGDTSGGDLLEDLIWTGGLIDTATTIGIHLSYEDAICHNITLNGVGFENCTGTALDINGAQSVSLAGYWFKNNTKNINIADDSAALTPATEDNNKVMNVIFHGGRWNGGTWEITGRAQNVRIKDSKIEDVDFTLTTTMDNFLVFENCFEDSLVTIAGETTKLLRETKFLNGASFGVTTDATVTTAWTYTMKPGQAAYLVAKVVARSRNDVENAFYHVGCGVIRPGSTLLYDSQTANFTAGAILTGATSGATARIQKDVDGGTTGTLTLIDIVGAFQNNEVITDDNGTPGSADVNGTLTAVNVALSGGGNVDIRAVDETVAGWAAIFVISGAGDIEFRVTGASGDTVEWNVDVEVIST